MTDEREVRLQRLQTLRDMGINPYPNSAERTHTIADVLSQFETYVGPEGSFTLVGRVRLLREMGKATFAKIEDGTGSIQIYLRVNDLLQYPTAARRENPILPPIPPDSANSNATTPKLSSSQQVRSDGFAPGENVYQVIKLLDLGDFVQVTGFLFVTR